MGAGPDSITFAFQEKPHLGKTTMDQVTLWRIEHGRRDLVSLRGRVVSEQELRRDILQAILPLHGTLTNDERSQIRTFFRKSFKDEYSLRSDYSSHLRFIQDEFLNFVHDVNHALPAEDVHYGAYSLRGILPI